MKKKNRRMHTGNKARHNRKLVILSGVVAASAIILVALAIVYALVGTNSEETEIQDVAVFEASFAILNVFLV